MGVQNFIFRKMDIFGDNEDFVDILGVITKFNYIKGSFLCILGYFLKVRYKMGIYFWVAKVSNIFWGCLKFQIFFWFEG